MAVALIHSDLDLASVPDHVLDLDHDLDHDFDLDIDLDLDSDNDNDSDRDFDSDPVIDLDAHGTYLGRVITLLFAHHQYLKLKRCGTE